MATVFLAEDPRHHRRIALKVLHPGIAAAPGPERFVCEIETVAGPGLWRETDPVSRESPPNAPHGLRS